MWSVGGVFASDGYGNARVAPVTRALRKAVGELAHVA